MTLEEVHGFAFFAHGKRRPVLSFGALRGIHRKGAELGGGGSAGSAFDFASGDKDGEGREDCAACAVGTPDAVPQSTIANPATPARDNVLVTLAAARRCTSSP